MNSTEDWRNEAGVCISQVASSEDPLTVTSTLTLTLSDSELGDAAHTDPVVCSASQDLPDRFGVQSNSSEGMLTVGFELATSQGVI